MNPNRRNKLTEGECDCGAEAQIPWKNHKLCYGCWNTLQNSLREIEKNEREKKAKEEKEEIKRSNSFSYHPQISGRN